MMNKRWVWILVMLILGLVFPGRAGAAYGINRTINFQGKLVNASGVNVPNSTPVTATFAIYQTNSSCPGGGTAVWSENQTFTPVDGIFQVALGSQTAFGTNIDFSQDTLYLGIKISTETDEMCSGASRIRLAAVPQAFNAESFAGLTADNSLSNSFTITGGQGSPATLKVEGDITLGSIISPTNDGGLIIVTNGTGSALSLNTGNTASGTAGDIAIDVGTSAAGNGSILIGTATRTQTITIGNTTGGTITIGAASGSDLVLQDADWGVTGAGVADFITGSSLGTLTFTTNNIADSGALTIKSATGANALTLDSGSTGDVNLGTGANAKSINIGTGAVANTITIGSASATGVSITDDNWLIDDTGSAEFDQFFVTGMTDCDASGNKLLWDESTRQFVCGIESGLYSVRLSGNYTNATVNFTDVDDDATGTSSMAFPIGANETWLVEITAQYNSPAAADSQVQITCPAGATGVFAAYEVETGAQVVSNLGCGASTGNLGATGTDDAIDIKGTVVNGSTAGTVQVQYAQIVASGTSTIYAGSHLVAIQVGGGSGGPTISLTGDVTGTGQGTIATTIGADKVVSSMILDGTIAGGDLATNISISTTGNLTTTGGGVVTSAGAIVGPTATNTINGLVVNAATQTLAANSISDAGALTISSAVNALLTLQSANNGVGATGGVTLVTGNAGSGTAGNVAIDVGSSTSGNGSVLIGTAARAQTITIGNTTGGTITIGGSSGSDLVLQDANWGVTGAGAATLASMTATTGNVAITSGELTLGGTTRVSNTGAGTFITGTTIGSLTFTTNNIADSGGLTIKSAAGANDIIVDSGTTGSVLIGTGANAKTISIGTAAVANTITIGSVSATGVSITDNNWSVAVDGTASFGAISSATNTSINASNYGVDFTDSDVNPGCAAGDYKIYADTGDTRLKKCQNGVVSDLAQDSDIINRAKNADQSVTNSNVLVDETALQFTIGATEEWNVIWDLVVSNNNSGTPDWKAAVVGPAAVACNVVQSGSETAGAVFLQASTTDCIPAPGDLINSAIVASAIPFNVRITANVTGGGNAGTVKMRFAENTAGAGTSITVLAGSIMTAYRVTGADLAEFYYTRDETLTAGDVVGLDSLLPDGVRKTSSAYDGQTMGVISTQAGLVMGSGSGGNGFPALVALSGRVPVKVSGENGPIKPGDMLTAGSIPGVAMRMTKAGQSIGMAMTGYDGPGAGMVTVFVNTGYVSGLKVLDLVAENGSPEVKSLLSQGEATRATLKYVLDKQTLMKDNTDLSEMLTDRVVAGLEMVTPRLTADKVFARVISGLGKENLTIETDGGQIEFTASGSAVFSGGVTAGWIRANRIEGLEILAKKFSGLEERVAGMSGGLTITPSPWPLPTITQAPAVDLTVLGELIAKKSLSVAGQAVFEDRVEFKGPVVLGNLTWFNKDTAGFALIRKDSDRVEIVFEKEYPEPPIVSANIAIDLIKDTTGAMSDDGNRELEKQILQENYTYMVTRKTTRGFTIVLNKIAQQDLAFSWTAFFTKHPQMFSSVFVMPASPTPLVTPLVSPTVIPDPATESGQILEPLTWGDR